MTLPPCSQAGFCKIERVKTLNIFPDTSSMVYKGRLISLNVLARPCLRDDDDVEDFGVTHAATYFEDGESID